MQQPMGGMRPPMQPRPMNPPPMGMPSAPTQRPMQPPMQPPQQQPAFGQFGGNIPRPMGGGIMGGQPQAPRPFQQPMNGPRGPLR